MKCRPKLVAVLRYLEDMEDNNMATQGKRRKNKPQGKGQGNQNDPEAYGDMQEDTTPFAIDEKAIFEAEGYQLDEDWEPWDGDDSEETPVEDESHQDETYEETYDGAEEEDYSEEGTEEEYSDEEDYQGPPKRNVVAECDHCGEEYSVTYRRCPFCDERSGKKPAVARGATYGPGAGMDPRHFVGFSISMVLIFTAGFIVLQEVTPLLRPQKSTTTPKEPSEVVEDFDSSLPDDFVLPDAVEVPDAVVNGDSTDGADTTVVPDEVVEGPEPALEFETEQTPDDTVSTGAVVLSSTDVSLRGDESFTLKVTSGGTVKWTSSHPDIASVDSNGRVTNLNTAGSTKIVEITATVDGDSSGCLVRCATGTGAGASSSSSSSSTDSSTSTDSSSSDSSSSSTGATSNTSGVTTGAAKITNAAGGLRIRSGPGTTYDVLATGNNGSVIVVDAASTDGWYEITFTGDNGKQTGYILGEYIAMD